MEKYRVMLLVNVKSGWASLKDLEWELECFNLANGDAIEAQVIGIEKGE